MKITVIATSRDLIFLVIYSTLAWLGYAFMPRTFGGGAIYGVVATFAFDALFNIIEQNIARHKMQKRLKKQL